MQRNGGLPGTGTALDYQDAGVRRPDDRILLGLQRADDVAHPASPRGLDRGQKRRLARQPAGTGEVLPVQHLVVQAGHPAAAHGDVAAAPDAVRRARGGYVEGARCRGAPVHQQRLALTGLIAQADPPDVTAFPGPQVKTAKAHAALGRFEPGKLLAVPRDRGVPFEPGLSRPAVLPERQRKPRRRLLTQHVDALVQPRDVLLLTPDLTNRQLLPLPGKPTARLPGEITEKQSCTARRPSAVRHSHRSKERKLSSSVRPGTGPAARCGRPVHDHHRPGGRSSSPTRASCC